MSSVIAGRIDPKNRKIYLELCDCEGTWEATGTLRCHGLKFQNGVHPPTRSVRRDPIGRPYVRRRLIEAGSGRKP